MPLPIESDNPPQAGDRSIVSSAGSGEMSEMRKKEAPSDLRRIGRKAQIIPVGPKARAEGELDYKSWCHSDRPGGVEEKIQKSQGWQLFRQGSSPPGQLTTRVGSLGD